MAKDFSKERFLQNVSFLLEAHKDIKIGELEAYAGVNAGYLARLNKDEKAKPSIEFIVKIAERFQISIDSLLGIELYQMTPTERYMHAFLEKLLSDTEAEKLNWGIENASFLNNLVVDDFKRSPHPFFALSEGVSVVGPEPRMRCIFYSQAYGDQTIIADDCYHLHMNKGASLFLANVAKKAGKQPEPETDLKEIWMKTKTPCFISSTKNPHFTGVIDNLFNAIAQFFKQPRLGADYRTAIDDYMVNNRYDGNQINVNNLFPDETPF